MIKVCFPLAITGGVPGVILGGNREAGGQKKSVNKLLKISLKIPRGITKKLWYHSRTNLCRHLLKMFVFVNGRSLEVLQNICSVHFKNISAGIYETIFIGIREECLGEESRNCSDVIAMM